MEENEIVEDGSLDKYFQAMLDDDIENLKRGILEGFTGLSKSSSGDMALHFACLNSKLECLCLLHDTLKEGDINTINIEHDDTICGTALHMSMDGQVCAEVVEMLLQWGADPNAMDAKGSPVLHELIYRAWEDFGEDFDSEDSMWEDEKEENTNECVIYERSAKTVKPGDSYIVKLKLLHRYGANVNIVNTETGLSALHFWCQNFHWLMESCLDSNLTDWCQRFFETMVKLGADFNAKDKKGETAVVYLTQRHYKPHHMIFIESYRSFIKVIVSKLNTGNAKQKNMFGRTLLHSAAEHSNYVFIEELLDVGFDANVKDKFGLSPLHISTHNLAKDEATFVQHIILSLDAHGGDLNSQDDTGSTPLHHAVLLNNHMAIRSLLQLGASLELRDSFERSPKHCATLYGDPITQNLLEKPSSTDINGQLAVVSDSRYGWFFPLCCHKQYNLDNRGNEDPEKVNEHEIKLWLEKYPMCFHNTTFVLQNSIASLGTDKEQVKCDEIDAMTIRREIYDLVVKIASKIGAQNPLFLSSVIFGGSVVEGTKVGSCDEFDFVFDLYKIREVVAVEECEGNTSGFVKLKVKDRETLRNFESLDLVDENGYLKRLETSNRFHKYLEKVITSECVWKNNRFFTFWGTTNSQGECFNIGQLQLVWYGPSLKREDVSVDIAPVIRMSGWQSQYLRSNIKIINTDVVHAVGCYLMMKDPTRYLQNFGGLSFDEEDTQTKEVNFLFKISISQIEHACMQALPINIRNAYSLAKSIQLQCPHLLFKSTPLLMVANDYLIELFEDKDGNTRFIEPVWEYLSSYVIKTGLFYELHESGIHVLCSESDFENKTWNETVLRSPMFLKSLPSKTELKETKQWALRIYKRILTLVSENKKIPEYFLSNMEATKIPGGSGSFVTNISTFLNTLVYLLEHFEIP